MRIEHWQRHANPWSVWTRLATVPLIALAFYARVWIGWWSLVAIAFVCLWLWLNVRIFVPIYEPERWESRAIYGERLWLESKSGALPRSQLARTRAPLITSLVFAALAIWGVVVLAPIGSAGIIAGQLWFLRRLAVLYEAAVTPSPTPAPDRR